MKEDNCSQRPAERDSEMKSALTNTSVARQRSGMQERSRRCAERRFSNLGKLLMRLVIRNRANRYSGKLEVQKKS